MGGKRRFWNWKKCSKNTWVKHTGESRIEKEYVKERR